AVSMGGIGANDICVYSLRIEHLFVGRFFNRFAGVFVQLRLDVKALDVADAATEKNPDNRFRLRRRMRPAFGWMPGRGGGVSAGNAIPDKHCRQRQPRESHSRVNEKGTAGDARASVLGAIVLHAE